MANKNLFASLAGKLLPKADVINEAGGKAYAFSPQHALARCGGPTRCGAGPCKTGLTGAIPVPSKSVPVV